MMIFYIVIILSILGLCLFQIRRKESKVPPGLKDIPIEKGLPIIGILHKIEDHMYNYLFKLSQKHGPIYRIKFGMRDIVVLNNFEFLKAALVDNGDALAGRWKSLKYLFVVNESGLSFIEGNIWAKQKQFVIKTLKDFGMGRSRSAEIVQEECMHLLNDLSDLNGESVDFSHFIPIYSANVISKFVMNKRYTHGDPGFQILDKVVTKVTNSKDPIAMFCLMFPMLEKSEWLMKFIMWITERKFDFDCCDKIFENEVIKHSNELDLNSEGEDLMDRFLITQHQLKITKNDVESFTNFQLVKNGSELLVAGYDTTSSTLVWSFMFMAMYPEVQNKVHKEINDQIGNEKLPTMSDKISFNYTQAVMDEIMRLSSVVPLSIIHRTLNDVNVKGYFISKDTVVIPNIFACHLDPNTWEKPFEFYPEHFLSTNEDGFVKYKPRPELIPFSIGKRQCLGESLARIEYFIFFTSVLQRFCVSYSKKVIGDDVLNSNSGFVRTSKVKDFVFTSRL